MLDMGDFAGGMLKYIARHPIARVTIGGGIGKLSKLGQGAVDLHSSRSQVDLQALADLIGDPQVARAETALHAYEIAGPRLAEAVAASARVAALRLLKNADTTVDVVLVDRAGQILARAG